MKRTKACTIWWAGVAASSAAFLISVVGISNTIGRVISGAFTDLPFVRWSLWLFTHIHDQNVHTAPWWWQPSPWPWEQPALHSWPSVRPTGILTFISWVIKLDQDNDCWFQGLLSLCLPCLASSSPPGMFFASHFVLILDFYNDIMIHLLWLIWEDLKSPSWGARWPLPPWSRSLALTCSPPPLARSPLSEESLLSSVRDDGDYDFVKPYLLEIFFNFFW